MVSIRKPNINEKKQLYDYWVNKLNNNAKIVRDVLRKWNIIIFEHGRREKYFFIYYSDIGEHFILKHIKGSQFKPIKCKKG